MMKILAYPKDINPYQELLYAPMRKRHNVKLSYGKFYPYIGASIFLLLSLLRRIQGYRLLHIHWQTFCINVNVPYAKKLSYWNTMMWFWWLRLLGYRVVWTAHNIVPHEPQTTNDIEVTRKLVHLAKATIVHSSFTATQMQQRGVDTFNTKVIPIGNYMGLYPDGITPKEARAKSHIKPDEFVILFFGLVRAYKGVDDLIEAYSQLKRPNIRLVIAGLCDDTALKEKITKSIQHLNIDFYEGHVRDEDVATYFKACNVVCLPFKSITTSSTALLAMSFGRPLVAPRIGALLDLPDDVGYLYNPKDVHSLLRTLKKSISNADKLIDKGDAAFVYAKSLGWDKISDQTYELYREILDSKETV